MQDESLTPIKRVEIALRKFGRMSDSEIVTPLNVAEDVVKLLPEDVFHMDLYWILHPSKESLLLLS